MESGQKMPINGQSKACDKCFQLGILLLMDTEQIFLALREGQFDQAQDAIIKNPESLSCRDGSGVVLAHLVTGAGALPAIQVKFSLEVLELTNERGWTVAHVAAARGSLAPLAESLGQYPHLLHWEDHQGETPVHLAARAANLGQINWQQHYSALSHPNRLLETPAHLAARIGDFQSIAPFAGSELLMLRDLSGAPVLDEVALNSEFKELVPHAIYLEAYRRLGRWSPPEMLQWTLTRNFEPAAAPKFSENPLRGLLNIASQIRKIEDGLFLEEIFHQSSDFSSPEDFRQKAATLIAREYPQEEINSAINLMKITQSHLAGMGNSGQRITSTLKRAAKNVIVGQLGSARDHESEKTLAGSVGTAMDAFGKLRAMQYDLFCQTIREQLKTTNPSDAIEAARKKVKEKLYSGCPEEWSYSALASVDPAAMAKITEERSEFVRTTYFNARNQGLPMKRAFKRAESDLCVYSKQKFAQSPLSDETLEWRYQDSRQASIPAGPGKSYAAPPEAKDVDWGAEDYIDEDSEGFEFSAADINFDAFVEWRKAPKPDDLSAFVWGELASDAQDLLTKGASDQDESSPLFTYSTEEHKRNVCKMLAGELTRLVSGTLLSAKVNFPKSLVPKIVKTASHDHAPSSRTQLNRTILLKAYSKEVSARHKTRHTYGPRLVHASVAYEEEIPAELRTLAAQANQSILEYCVVTARDLFGESSCAHDLYRQQLNKILPVEVDEDSEGSKTLLGTDQWTPESISAALKAASAGGSADKNCGDSGPAVVCQWYLPALINYFRLDRKFLRYMDKSDLWEAALTAYSEAHSRYRPSRGSTLPAYAWRRIKGAILDFVRQRASLSRGMQEKKQVIEKAIDKLESSLGRMPDGLELLLELGPSNLLGLSPDDGHACTELQQLMVHCGIGDETQAKSKEDWNSVLMSKPDVRGQEATERGGILEAIYEEFETLSPKDRRILLCYLLAEACPETVTVKALASVMSWSYPPMSRAHKLIQQRLKRKVLS
jgi:RNA polymerase sigma factor for flagellar operon FliA